jgi:hypothetical protein
MTSSNSRFTRPFSRKPRGPALNVRTTCTFTRIRRQDDDSNLRKITPNSDDGLDAAHVRHLQVYQRSLRTMLPGLFNRFDSGRYLRDHLHVRFGVDQPRDPVAQRPVIVTVRIRITTVVVPVAGDASLIQRPFSFETVRTAVALEVFRMPLRPEPSIQFRCPLRLHSRY